MCAASGSHGARELPAPRTPRVRKSTRPEGRKGGSAALSPDKRDALARAFRARYGRAPACGARAPGRVNLIGEHTDYCEGLVLPLAIDRDTQVLAAPRDDGRFRLFSLELGEAPDFHAKALVRRGHWSDYAQGVVFALRESGSGSNGPPRSCGGADLAIASDVPLGSGLSSSAALELALLTALDRCHGLRLDARECARLAHRAESGFVGVPCGVMDQLASALGRRDVALRIDCRSLEVTPVPLRTPRLRLLVAHSGVTRALVRGGYARRRAECEEALASAQSLGLAAGARALRDLSAADLPALEARLDPRLARRVRHVVTENARVDAVCHALRTGDLRAVGSLLQAGMRSLRDHFEVSTPELDALCEIADRLPAVYGSRLTGAGFGGCTLHLVDPGAASPVSTALAEGFERRFARRPPIWTVAPADGASLVPL